jgi:hypothetical protein
VVVGLIDALKANFPAVCRIVGEEFFRAMTRAYVSRHPPASPILHDYGAGFADFVAGFAPTASLPYLADIARLERAWLEAYHSAEREPLSPACFAALPVDQVSELRFELHPSLRIARSRFPAITIWNMNVSDGVPGPVDLDAGGEDALILRAAADVEVRMMAPGGAEFISTLASGRSLGAAMKSALQASNSFDLAADLTALIDAGAFTAVTRPTAS